jgi:ribosomal protein S18 acetylase RimI-like enzyme
MTEEIVIRSLTLQDKDQYMDLFTQMLSIDFRMYSEKTKQFLIKNKDHDFDSEVASERFFYFGAFQDTKLVAITNGMSIEGGVATCVWLLVYPDFQHQGIGKKLLQTMEAALIKNGIHSVHLYSSKWNNSYYEKMGFEQVGLYKNAWYGSSDYLYAKTIQQPKEENFLR